MTWLQVHWLELFTAWVALNSVLSPISAKVPVVGFWGKALHVFVAISPMDLLKAFKVVGAQMAVPLATLAAVCMIQLIACASVTPLEQYRTDSLACVSSASTKAMADLCRTAVEVRYCGDGGALVDSGACSDGGAE